MNKRQLIFFALSALTAATLFAASLFQKELRDKPLPAYGAVTDFHLTDQSGKPFSPRELLGKVWVADFIFTSCGNICPTMSKNMAALQRSYKLEGNVHFVSISVNPETDSPAVLTEYAQKYKADFKSWHFLTGSREEITKIAVYGFKVGDIKEPIFHSSYFILVDKRGRIRGYYDGTTQEGVRKTFVDLAKIRKEK